MSNICKYFGLVNLGKFGSLPSTIFFMSYISAYFSFLYQLKSVVLWMITDFRYDGPTVLLIFVSLMSMHVETSEPKAMLQQCLPTRACANTKGVGETYTGRVRQGHLVTISPYIFKPW